ncbi:hypothetical protein F4820DRAFT_470140 [Hypoxylon rubiginosum]|uniref:Uncharacterized protein n=1 Tax=Hypoxylon rubiginosum TaxID=110542 RepID=A0ACB9ZEL8_9PEZI|nr:hypothetical protein F4820DRAFT_470140 [Hypoxylon rubiginosum]
MTIIITELNNFVRGTPLECAMDSVSNQLIITDSLLRQLDIVRNTSVIMDSTPAHLDARDVSSDSRVSSAANKLTVITLDSLPGEIHLLILDSLRDEADWKTIISLGAASKKWSQIAAPYTAIPIGLDDWQAYAIQTYSDEDADGEDCVIEDGQYYTVSPIQKVCFKLGQPNCRPDWIKVLPTAVFMGPPWVVLTSKNPKTRGRLEQVLSPLGHILSWDLREQIILGVLHSTYDEIRDGYKDDLYDDAEFALILATCVGLEHIQPPHILGQYFGTLSRMVIQCAGRQTQEDVESGQVCMLGQLKRLELTDLYRQIEVLDVIDMLYLPKIQDIRLQGLVNTLREGSRGDPSPSTNKPIQRPIDLTLDDCPGLTDNGLACILASCPRIRTLYLDSYFDQPGETTPVCFTGALDTYGQNLEFLWLDTNPYGSGLAQVPGQAQRLLRAINKMRNLRTLMLCREDFDDVKSLGSMLPSSLRELMVIGHRDKKKDKGDKGASLGLDRDSLFSLIHHPDLPNLEIVLVISPDSSKYCNWRKFVNYCKEFRHLPPSVGVTLPKVPN